MAGQKKKAELLVGRLVAQAVNLHEGTDYEVELSPKDPPDVFFKSKSGKHETRNGEIVSIPIDWRHRHDNQNVEFVQAYLKDSLEKLGMKGVLIGLTGSEQIERKGLKKPDLENAAKFIYEQGQQEKNLFYEELIETVPEIAERFRHIWISHIDAIPGVHVDLGTTGTQLPPDGRWIQEGIDKKQKQYTDEVAKTLTLIIESAGFIDGDQIDVFLREFRPEDTPFPEIWINTVFNGVIALKTRNGT